MRELNEMKNSRRLLIIAGALSCAVALFQLVITFSIPWSLYFGAPRKIVSNPPLLYVSGVVAALFFLVFGLYALSGAGAIRRMPLVRTGLIMVTVLYVLRGLLLVPEVLAYMYNPHASMVIPHQALWSSVVSLVIGIVYLVGIMACWKEMPKKERTLEAAA